MRYHLKSATQLICSVALAGIGLTSAALAEDSGMRMPAVPPKADQPAPAPENAKGEMQSMPGMAQPSQSSPTDSAAMKGIATDGDMSGMDMSGMNMSGGMKMMSGATGGYSMMRDASGTAWQPDSTPMEGINGEYVGWTTMLHGYVSGVFDHQGGPRGDDKNFSESMLMGMAQRQVGVGSLTLRTMLSLDPLMGKSGYPLLLQTGETANGATPLVDRQHPHDLFMELAGIYSVPVGDKTSVFGYVGYPGEPALGPPTFMHRFSGMDDPAAPITHHWLDSTHITFGVVTAGVVHGPWKLEASAFNGREPDQYRWNFDRLQLNSASARLSWNPTSNSAMQVSYGFIKSPEQLEPDVNQHRITASASYNRPFEHGNWQSTVAWGRNVNQPGHDLDAFLLESAVSWNQHALFARAESAQKDELFQAPSPLTGEVFRVSSFSLGYVYDIPVLKHLALGLGVVGTVYDLPRAIEPAYGSSPTSVMGFVRVKLK